MQGSNSIIRVFAGLFRCALDSPVDKFLIDNFVLILLAVVSGGLLFWPMFSKRAGESRVNTTEAVMLINREKAVLIDVSEAKEFAEGHAAGAKSVPLGGLETSSDLPKNKTLPLVVLCPTGSRANRAVATLKKLGYENSRALVGGTAAWREASLPIEKSAA
jgi:rhodanese-related sulfurtransferase